MMSDHEENTIQILTFQEKLFHIVTSGAGNLCHNILELCRVYQMNRINLYALFSTLSHSEGFREIRDHIK